MHGYRRRSAPRVNCNAYTYRHRTRMHAQRAPARTFSNAVTASPARVRGPPSTSDTVRSSRVPASALARVVDAPPDTGSVKNSGRDVLTAPAMSGASASSVHLTSAVISYSFVSPSLAIARYSCAAEV